MHATRRKDRLGIPHAVGFQQMQSLKKLWSHIFQGQFTVELESRIEVRKGKARTGESVEPCAEFWDVCRGHGESAGVSVAAVT